MSKLKIALLLCLLLALVQISIAQDHTPLKLDQAYQFQLQQTTGKYSFQIDKESVKAVSNDKWYFFVDLELAEKDAWQGTNIKLTVNDKKDKKQKKGGAGIDSCFFTNKEFNYVTEEIHASIFCTSNCSFKLSAEISAPYNLTIGESLRLDFEQTAYTKIFRLDTTKYDGQIDELRIVLKPEAFLAYASPISLKVFRGQKIENKPDYKSLTLWDNGEGVFISGDDAIGVFTLQVEGPQKNVLILETQVIFDQKPVKLTNNLPYFDHLRTDKYKSYQVQINPSKINCLKLTTFTGSLGEIIILNSTMGKLKTQLEPINHKYGQIEYELSPEYFKKNQIKTTSKIYYQITSFKQSTFVLESYIKDNNITHLLPEVNRYVDLKGGQFSQYYIDLVEIDIPQFKSSKFEIILKAKPDIQIDVSFFRCRHQHGKKCQFSVAQRQSYLKSPKNFKKTNITQVAKKNYKINQQKQEQTIYYFDINNTQFMKIGTDTKRYILTMLISSVLKRQISYNIQYINYGKNVHLKEGVFQSDRISFQEKKYYVFTNMNKEVRQIRVHLTEVAGRVFMRGSYTDPRIDDTDTISQFRNSLRFVLTDSQDQISTIYIEIEGKEASYYGLSLQLFKENERQWWQKQKHKQTKVKGYNQIILQNNIPYQFYIEPNQKVVYQIHSKNKQFELEMSSSLPVHLCMTEHIKLEPFNLNCQVSQNSTVKTSLQHIMLQNSSIANIGLTNLQNKVVKFNIRYIEKSKEDHEQKQKQSKTQICILGTLGKIIKGDFSEHSSSICYQYQIDKNLEEDIEISFDLLNKQYEMVQISIDANRGKLKQTMYGSAVYIFKKENINPACESVLENQKCLFQVYLSSMQQSSYYFTVQKLGGTVILLDGVANSFSDQKDERKFIFELNNKVNTTIIVQSQNNYFKFYGAVVEASTYWNNNNIQFPSVKSKIQSTNPFYYLVHIFILNETIIKAAQCTECLLLLTVIRQQSEFEGNRNGGFIIECTQENRFLKKGKAVSSYLGPKSSAFYEYYNKNDNATIIVSVNTQNQQCLSIYLKKGTNERATRQSYVAAAQKIGILVYQSAEKGSYSITLEAQQNKDCHFSIEATSSKKIKISNIQTGKSSDVNLQQKQKSIFIYNHPSNDSFKILTLHKQKGQLLIQAKFYSKIDELLKFEKDQNIKYQWSGKDFLKIKNTTKLAVKSGFYLIVISAERSTKSTIMIPGHHNISGLVKYTEFPLIIDSIVKDQLLAKQEARYKIFTDKFNLFEINILYGKIIITIVDPNQKQKVQFQGTYIYSGKTIYENFTVDKGNDFQFLRRSIVYVKALKDSSYSFGMITNKDDTKRGEKVKYGVPQYIMINQNQQKCIFGEIDNNNEQFLISITGDQSQTLMNQLILTGNLGQKRQKAIINRMIGKNQMFLTLNNKLDKYPVSYEFCIKSPKHIFITFIHSSRVNYFPQSTSIMVVKQMNLSFYTEGKSVIQINQCKSRAVLSLSSNFDNLKGINSEVRQIRKTNNIIEFSHYGPIYLHAESQSVVLRWYRKNETSGKGFVYDQYSSSKIRTQKVDNQLKIQIFPLQSIKEPKNTIAKILYISFIAQEQMPLYEAINCRSGTYLTNMTETSNRDKPVQLSFNIQNIISKFKKNKYVLVGVAAIVKFNNDLQEDSRQYRFIYPYQQVSMSYLQLGKIEQIPAPKKDKKTDQSNGFNDFVTYLAISLLVIIVTVIFYRKVIRKLLRRKRKQKLSDQINSEVKYTQFTSYT